MFLPFQIMRLTYLQIHSKYCEQQTNEQVQFFRDKKKFVNTNSLINFKIVATGRDEFSLKYNEKMSDS